MKTSPKQHFIFFMALALCLNLFACGGNGGGSSEAILDDIADFTPSENDDLTSQVINTFLDAGYDISVSPEEINFSEIYGDLEKDDEESV